MGDRTGIEWTDATWNPLRGCTAFSAGCDHCYAATLAARFSGDGLPYEGLAEATEGGAARWTGRIMLVPEKLQEPLRWQKPRRVFVNSMSDLFHAKVPQSYIDRVFAVMLLSQRHTYQILTKRPGRMLRYLNDTNVLARIAGECHEITRISPRFGTDARISWPLPNVWVGTSVEDQRVAHRIGPLLECPAAVRFLSCEPLIGPLDLDPWLGETAGPARSGRSCAEPGLDWVIVGGESGQHHRPMHPAWARTLRDQCAAARIPFFFKQWGGASPKANGRTLDGREWSEYPRSAVQP